MFGLFNKKEKQEVIERSKRPILESLVYFRAMGFFEKEKNLSDKDLVEKLMSEDKDMPFAMLMEGDNITDLDLLMSDESRVWFNDLEDDSDNAYANFVKDLGKISRGGFRPGNVSEEWKDNDSLVEIRFTVGGKEFVHSIRDPIGWLDPSMLRVVNEAIKNNGYQFEVHVPEDQFAFIVALTGNEKKKLEEERGWKFADF
jgi:hypothetical protein